MQSSQLDLTIKNNPVFKDIILLHRASAQINAKTIIAIDETTIITDNIGCEAFSASALIKAGHSPRTLIQSKLLALEQDSCTMSPEKISSDLASIALGCLQFTDQRDYEKLILLTWQSAYRLNRKINSHATKIIHANEKNEVILNLDIGRRVCAQQQRCINSAADYNIQDRSNNRDIIQAIILPIAQQHNSTSAQPIAKLPDAVTANQVVAKKSPIPKHTSTAESHHSTDKKSSPRAPDTTATRPSAVASKSSAYEPNTTPTAQNSVTGKSSPQESNPTATGPSTPASKSSPQEPNTAPAAQSSAPGKSSPQESNPTATGPSAITRKSSPQKSTVTPAATQTSTLKKPPSQTSATPAIRTALAARKPFCSTANHSSQRSAQSAQTKFQHNQFFGINKGYQQHNYQYLPTTKNAPKSATTQKPSATTITLAAKDPSADPIHTPTRSR